jgi:uncharacterized protein with PIN domain
MIHVTFRFYAELNQFLPPPRQQVPAVRQLRERASVKDVIEAVGVPHTEVDLILLNGHSVDFAYRVQDGDRISVYPVFEALDITPVLRVRPKPLREPRFVLDTHLGKLAVYLRLLGFDTLYRNDYDDDTLAQLSSSERRILLTRDRGVLKRRIVTHGCHLWETDPERQVGEVLRRFALFGAIAPFSRCPRCNGVLAAVDKAAIAAQLPPYTRASYHEFHRCQNCDRLYWKGAHYQRLQQLVQRLSAR